MPTLENDNLLLDFLAGAVGFEPTNADSKNRCLTAWRRPMICYCLYIFLVFSAISNITTVAQDFIGYEKKYAKVLQYDLNYERGFTFF